MENTDLSLLMDVTELGNSLLLGAFSLVVAIYLLALGYRREPLAMVLSFIIPASIIGTLKIAFYICGTNLWGIVSPSGHAAISIGVLGLSSLIFTKICSGIWRAILPLVLVLLALTIAISRTILGMHTDGDVVIGSVIGVAVVILIAKVILSYRVNNGQGNSTLQTKSAQPLIILVLMIGVVGASYGIKLPSEKLMKSIAKGIKNNMPICTE